MEYSLIVVAAIGAVSSIIVSLLNRKKIEKTGDQVGSKIDSLHVLINSNLTRQIEASIAEALGRGMAMGIEQERQRKGG